MSRTTRPGLRSPALSLLADDPDYLAEIVERYQDGETLTVIAGDIGVNASHLSGVLRRAGCPMRPSGGDHRR